MLTMTIMDLRYYARTWHEAGTDGAKDREPTPYTQLLDEISRDVVREREGI